MEYDECPYCEVIPYRYGNEYAEAYKCSLEGTECIGSKCGIISGKPIPTQK